MKKSWIRFFIVLILAVLISMATENFSNDHDNNTNIENRDAKNAGKAVLRGLFK